MNTSMFEQMRDHLIRNDGQEDLCFAVWRPSTGAVRNTALLVKPVLPREGERHVHGNVSFEGDYFLRAAQLAAEQGGGIALLHSHPGAIAWQGMSEDDIAAESGHAGQAMAITGFPMLGLTLAGASLRWSARFWQRVARREYQRIDCDSVRVVGDQMRMSYNPELRPTGGYREELLRTVSAWGEEVQADLSRLRLGVIGAGSVGSIVAEGLARMGVQEITLIDFDHVEAVNLDRLLHVRRGDIGRAKVEVLAERLADSATARTPKLIPIVGSVCSMEGYEQALDQDVLFSCVDRPWGRAVLNMIAYAHFIPVVDGGVMVDAGRHRMRGAEWRAHVAAPGRRCMECLGQFDPGMVQMERDGLLDDTSYLAELRVDHPLRRNENVFAFAAAAASAQLLQFLSMVVAPSGMADVRAQLFHFATGRLDVDTRACEPTCFYSGGLLGVGDASPNIIG